MYKSYENGKTDVIGGSFFCGSSIISLIRFITGVRDYKTMIEMAKKGDRFKCDLGALDIPLQDELKVLCNNMNIPLAFMSKLSREALESGEITNEDVCASCFANISTLLDRSLHLTSMLMGIKNFYLAGSLMNDNPIIEGQIGRYSGHLPTYPKIHYLDYASHLGIIGALLSDWN